jgi:hypothetical protein
MTSYFLVYIEYINLSSNRIIGYIEFMIIYIFLRRTGRGTNNCIFFYETIVTRKGQIETKF